MFNSQKKNESPENSAIQAQIAHLVGEMIGIKKTLQDFIKNHPLDSWKSYSSSLWCLIFSFYYMCAGIFWCFDKLLATPIKRHGLIYAQFVFALKKYPHVCSILWLTIMYSFLTNYKVSRMFCLFGGFILWAWEPLMNRFF